LLMTSEELEVWWAFTSVEVVDICCTCSVSSRKEMTTMTELDFVTLFNLNALVKEQVL
jgi:hypothetical protein